MMGRRSLHGDDVALRLSLRRVGSGPRAILMALGLAFTGLFLYLAVRDVAVADVWRSLRATDPGLVLASLVALAVAVVLRARRWQSLFARETRPPLRATLASSLVGLFFNSILPLRAGEAARVIDLCRRAGVPRSESGATVVAERGFDVLTLLALFFITFAWQPQLLSVAAAASVAGALLGVFAVVALVVRRYGARPFAYMLRPFGLFLPFSVDRREAAAGGLVRGLSSLRSIRQAVRAVVLTAASWLLLTLSAWVLLLGFDLPHSFLTAILVVVALNLALALPSSPSGLGVFEGATVLALEAHGASPAVALSYAMVLHAVNFFPFLAAGLIVVRTRRASG